MSGGAAGGGPADDPASTPGGIANGAGGIGSGITYAPPAAGGAVKSIVGSPSRPVVGGGSEDLVGSVIGGIARHVGPTVLPAVAIATTFGFPLALMLAVLVFLVVQSRLDGRDPKLRAAPLTTADTYLPFHDEAGR